MLTGYNLLWKKDAFPVTVWNYQSKHLIFIPPLQLICLSHKQCTDSQQKFHKQPKGKIFSLFG
jgi:hypothetical protein